MHDENMVWLKRMNGTAQGILSHVHLDPRLDGSVCDARARMHADHAAAAAAAADDDDTDAIRGLLISLCRTRGGDAQCE